MLRSGELRGGRLSRVVGGVFIVHLLAVAQNAAADCEVAFPNDQSRVVVACERAGEMLVAPVSLDGRAPARFLIDTGTDHTIVSQDYARERGIEVVGRTDDMPSLGSGVGIAHIERVGLGDVTFAHQFVGVWDLRGPGKPFEALSIQGVLGSDLLGQVVFAVDFHRGELVLFEQIPAGDAVTAREPIALELHGGRPVVGAQLTGLLDGDFVIDTGAQWDVKLSDLSVLLTIDRLRDAPRYAQLDRTWAGSDIVWHIAWEELRIADIRWSDVDLAAPTRPGGAASDDLAGQLGAGLWRDARLTFDYANRRMWLQRYEPVKAERWIRLRAAGDPDTSDLMGVTLLMRAAREDRADVMERLLEAGASIQPTDWREWNALAYAVASQGAEDVAVLLDAGADGRARLVGPGLRPAELAARMANVEALRVLVGHQKRQGAAIDVDSALVHACKASSTRCAKALLRSGASPDATIEGDTSALRSAVERGNERIVAMLVEAGADLTGPDAGAALYRAAERGEREIVKALLSGGVDVNQAAADGGTALSAAVMHGRCDVVGDLIAGGADVEHENANGSTARELAIRYGRTCCLRRLHLAGLHADQ